MPVKRDAPILGNGPGRAARGCWGGEHDPAYEPQSSGAWEGPPEMSAESLTFGDAKAELRTEGWVSLVTGEDTNQWALFWSP